MPPRKPGDVKGSDADSVPADPPDGGSNPQVNAGPDQGPLPIGTRLALGWKTTWVRFLREDSEFFDKRLSRSRALAVLSPALWLYVVWALMLVMLHTVGYLATDTAPNALQALLSDLMSTQIDVAARRAALAFSGVTLAITLALALTSLFWCVMSWAGKSGAFRSVVLLCVGGFLALSLWVSWIAANVLQPFTTQIGQVLLSHGSAGMDAPLAQDVPLLMFVLSCVVPGILLAGATFLLQPMTWPDPDRRAILKKQARLLLKRLRELDQMLYIGALALVFGTLQLSSGLSVALVSMPKAADLKIRTDLCKAMGPSSAASSPFFASPAAGLASTAARAFDARCQDLPGLALKLDSAESLRALVHGITICFGLAFSAMLAAIYVPTLFGLTSMLEPRQAALGGAAGAAHAASEPLGRIAAVAATLSPLFAGLLANTLAAG